LIGTQTYFPNNSAFVPYRQNNELRDYTVPEKYAEREKYPLE
jgi:hypothetical protein